MPSQQNYILLPGIIIEECVSFSCKKNSIKALNSPFTILFKSFVKPFYKENAGAFVFLFTMMFCIINKVDGAGVYEYHYSLVTGMLRNNVFLLLVFFVWFVYAYKYLVFVSEVLLKPEYIFLQMFNGLSIIKRFTLFFLVEILLLLPVLLYAVFIAFVGFNLHLISTLLVVGIYLLLLCVLPAMRHVSLLNNLQTKAIFSLPNVTGNLTFPSSYQVIIIRFVATKQKFIWASVKIFTCGILYLITRNNTTDDYDNATAFLFFNFGMLANGVLIYRIREFQETFISFYRALPVSLTKRLLYYFCIYFILSIPECITVAYLVPVHLHYADAVSFALCSLSLLLLMNSLTYFYDFKMREYVRILLLVFCLEYILLMMVGFVVLYLVLFALAIVIFYRSYNTFEQRML